MGMWTANMRKPGPAVGLLWDTMFVRYFPPRSRADVDLSQIYMLGQAASLTCNSERGATW